MSSKIDISKLDPRSRLFIGNLPTEKVTKQELFQIFSPYGDILEVVLKANYGFIQITN